MCVLLKVTWSSCRIKIGLRTLKEKAVLLIRIINPMFTQNTFTEGFSFNTFYYMPKVYRQGASDHGVTVTTGSLHQIYRELLEFPKPAVLLQYLLHHSHPIFYAGQRLLYFSALHDCF
jgi:hypothetical protein